MSTPSRMTLDPTRTSSSTRRRLHLREIVDAGPQEVQTVGSELRAARARSGLDLREIGDALRIRYRHLEAIECGYHSELPGMTYAVGFVRAYAEYLGLNPDDMVRRFKAEAGEVTMAAAAAAPSPSVSDLSFGESSERFKLPTGISMIVVLAVLIGAGTTWYMSRSGEQKLAREVPVAPAFEEPDPRLLRPHPSVPSARDTKPEPLAVELTATKAINQPEATQTAASDDAAEPAVSETTESEVPAAEVSVAEASSDEAQDDAVYTRLAPAREEQGPALADEPVSVETAAADEEIGPPLPGADELTLDANEELIVTTDEPLLPPVPATKPVLLASASQLADALNDQPRFDRPSAAAEMARDLGREPAYAEPVSQANIQILALSSSWLRIDDGEGRVLIQRRLREGEVFSVPPRQGLIMAARNAGAFQIMVDGRPVGRAGGDGEVLSGLSLNPGELRDRYASSDF